MEDYSQEKGPCLPLLSLQLLVPPLRLVSAAVLHTIQNKIVRDYGILDEFVTMVTELVPELLHDRERSLLSLGLRVQLVLELCRSEQPADLKTIRPHLNRIQSLTPLLSMTSEANDLLATLSECNFVGFIQNLLKDPDKRAHFFQDVYPVTFGPMYDESLQLLMSQFLSRLNNILPLPNLQQASSMLSGAPNILEECLESVSNPEGLGPLLEYHKDLSQLDEDDESVSSIGDCIFNALFQSVMENIPTGLELTKLDVPASALTDHIYSSQQVSMVDSAMLTEGAEDENKTIKEENQTEMESKKQFVDIIEGSQENVLLHSVPQVLGSAKETLSWDSSVTEAQIGANFGVFDKEVVWKEDRVDVEPVYETDWLITEDGDVEPFDIILLNEELVEMVEHSVEVDRSIKDESDSISWISELNEHEGTITLTDAIISSLRHTPKVKLIRLDPNIGTILQSCSQLQPISKKADKNNNSRKVCHGTSTSKSCLICGKIFSRVSELRLHERTHERRALPRFSCSMCKKHFRYMYDLKMHKVNLCQENVPDPRPAKTLSHVESGEDDISEDLKVLDCKVCGETFPYPSVLRRHIKRTHLGISLFECSKCSEQFTSESDFVKHQLDVCQDNVAKPIPSNELKYRKPSKYMNCGVCGKIFAKPSRLEYHMLTHNDERPYKCTYCEKTFKYLTHFRRHGEVCPLVSQKQIEDPSIDRTHVGTDQNDKLLSNYSILPSDSKQNQLTLDEQMDTHTEFQNELKEAGHVGSCQTAFSQNLENGPEQIEVCTYTADKSKDRKDVERAFGVTMSKPRRSRCRKSTIVTDGTGSEVCLICKLFVKGSMKCHLRTHSDVCPYSCPHCKVKFMFKNDLIKHMKGEHEHADAETLKKIERSLKCDECGKEFMFTSSLKQHKYTHNPLYCIECKRLFPSSVTLSTHRLMHKPRLCIICQERMNGLTELNQHYLEVHQFRGPFGCASCERSYTDLKGLFKHERVHTGELPFKCPKCPKSFSTKFALSTHNKTHTKEKPYLCWDCGKFYRNPGALRSHRLSIHANPGDKRFPCGHCGKDYSLKSTLSNHVKKCHSGVRYPCTYCGKQFLSASSLTRHDLIHTQERPFPCTECDKSFRSASELKIHTRYHTGERPFKCEQCGKGFTQSYHLTDHRRMHSGEKPYQCPTCGKCFRSPKAVQKHIVIHTGEKPYKCSVCDRVFNRTDVLKAHVKKSH